jgi:Ras family
MEDERVISYERGKQLAEQLGIEFFETSAKENVNVKVICIFHPCFETHTRTVAFVIARHDTMNYT